MYVQRISPEAFRYSPYVGGHRGLVYSPALDDHNVKLRACGVATRVLACTDDYWSLARFRDAGNRHVRRGRVRRAISAPAFHFRTTDQSRRSSSLWPPGVSPNLNP